MQNCMQSADVCIIFSEWVADLGAARVQDTEVFYDLKRLLEDSNADIPPQLARHEAAKNKPGTVGDKPRREQITYAA